MRPNTRRAPVANLLCVTGLILRGRTQCCCEALAASISAGALAHRHRSPRRRPPAHLPSLFPLLSATRRAGAEQWPQLHHLVGAPVLRPPLRAFFARLGGKSVTRGRVRQTERGERVFSAPSPRKRSRERDVCSLMCGSRFGRVFGSAPRSLRGAELLEALPNAP
jgi:hypothetical protein